MLFKLKIIAPPVTLDPCSEPSSDDDELQKWVRFNDPSMKITRRKSTSTSDGPQSFDGMYLSY